MEYGDRVRALRRRERLQQSEFAARVGASQGAVSNWERGVRVPSARTRARIAAAFGLTERRLFPPQRQALARGARSNALGDVLVLDLREPSERAAFGTDTGALAGALITRRPASTR
jgi:transcriptional regulator with XRE-family HTH domain